METEILRQLMMAPVHRTEDEGGEAHYGILEHMALQILCTSDNLMTCTEQGHRELYCNRAIAMAETLIVECDKRTQKPIENGN